MKRKLTLKRSSLFLALTGGIEFGLQIVIPMVFVRHLDPVSFGQYRLLWLIAGTALAFAPAFMPQSLFYFLPRASPDQQRTVVGNVIAYLAAAGCVVAMISGGWNPLLPDAMKHLSATTGGLSSLFVGMWVLVSLMTVLPTAEGRIHWQARSDTCMALVRTLLLCGAAMLTQDLVWVVWALLVEAIFRICLLLGYLYTRPGGWRIRVEHSSMRTQLRYSLPFAFGSAMFLMRAQADQWVVASMLPAAQFAAFSVSAVFLPVGALVRQPINNAIMASLNHAYSLNDIDQCHRLISKATGAIAMVLLPLAGGLFAVTNELVQLIYTDRYSSAAAVMRVYLIGIMFSAIAVGNVLTAMNEGRFVARSNAFFLIVSVVISIACTHQFGLIGAAYGSVGTLIISETWSLRKVAFTLNMPVYRLLPWKVIWPSALGSFLGVVATELVDGLANNSPDLRLMQKALVFVTFSFMGFIVGGGWRSASHLIRSSSL